MLFEHLFAHARATPDEIAITDDTGQYTYGRLAAMTAGLSMVIGRTAAASHVGLLLPAGAGFVASFYGTLLAGKTVVPINFLLGDREVAHVIRDSGIDTVITIPQLGGRLAGTPLKIIDLAQLARQASSPSPGTPGEGRGEGTMTGNQTMNDEQKARSSLLAAPPSFPNPSPDSIAVLMYTSGTSGLPKGVMLSYGGLQSDVDACIVHAALKRTHTFLGIIPLFHAFGMTAMMLAPLQLHSPIVYMARFSAVVPSRTSASTRSPSSSASPACSRPCCT